MAMTHPSPTFPMYPGDAGAVSQSDTVNLNSPSVIWTGAGGTIRVLTAQGSDVTFTNVQAGGVLPVQVIRVFSTTTTATGMLRIF